MHTQEATCESTICFISEKAVAASSIPSFQIHSHCSSARVLLNFSACETVVRLIPLPPHRRSVHHNRQASVKKEGMTFELQGLFLHRTNTSIR